MERTKAIRVGIFHALYLPPPSKLIRILSEKQNKIETFLLTKDSPSSKHILIVLLLDIGEQVMFMQLWRIEEEGEVHWNMTGKKDKSSQNTTRFSQPAEQNGKEYKWVRLLLNKDKAMLRMICIISLCCMSRNQKRDHEKMERIVAIPLILFQQVLFTGEWSCLSFTKHHFNLKQLLPLRQDDETVSSKD